MAATTNRAILLKARPHGAPTADTFELVEQPVPAPQDGEVVVRNLYLSIDPYMRGRLNAVQSYATPVEVGQVMTGECVGEVVESKSPALQPGDRVVGTRGWQSHAVLPAERLVKIPAGGAPVSAYLGVLGMPGTTAYSGLKDIGKPQAGETLVVSAASGAVGAVVGQLGKRAGARVVGIAGGVEKCRYVTEELGFDACVDHRGADLAGALKDACPKGIDVYFENVGGAVQLAVWPLLNPFARMPMCGMIAGYNDPTPAPGPNLMTVVGKRLHIQGFIVSDKPERFAEWRALAAPWVADGSLRYREDVVDGLENAPAALIGILGGKNFGKLVVKIAELSVR